MSLNRWMEKLYTFMEVVTMLAVLQLLWIGCSLLGLVIFGISPATVALFMTMRTRLRSREDLRSLTRQYWKTYKAEFITANKIGIILIGIGYFLIINWKIVLTMHGTYGLFMLALMVMITILYVVLLINIFQVFAHYELPFSRYFSAALLLSISFPLQVSVSIFGLYIMYLVFLNIPGLIPFFSVSLPVLFLTWMSSRIFLLKGESEGT